MNTLDACGLMVISFISAVGVYAGYRLCKWLYNMFLQVLILTRLTNNGRYNNYVMKRGNLRCESVKSFFNDNNVMCSSLHIDTGMKQIGNKTELLFDLMPTRNNSLMVATRPVNKMNYYTEWTDWSTKNNFGSNVMLDGEPIDISSVKVITEDVESRSYVISSDLLYKYSDINTNPVGRMLMDVIKDYKIPYDTKYVRITESVLPIVNDRAYVIVIGKYDNNGMFKASHMITSLKGDTIGMIIKNDIIGKK